MHRIILSALLPALLVQGSLSAQFNKKWGVPGSPTGQKVGVILEMVDRGDDDFTREMLGVHFSDAFVASYPMVEHLSLFRRLHDDLPGVQPTGVMRTDSGARFRAESGSGQTVSFTVQVDDGGRIVELEVDMGLGDPGEASGPERSLPELLEEWTEAGEFSGVVFCSRDGETLFAQAYGSADQRYDIPNTLETTFNLGSLNKAFTGAAICSSTVPGGATTGTTRPSSPTSGRCARCPTTSRSFGRFLWVSSPAPTENTATSGTRCWVGLSRPHRGCPTTTLYNSGSSILWV